MQELHYGALMRLCLSDNALGAQGAADLAALISDCVPGLESLQLAHNGIGDAGAVALAKALESGQCTLTSLYLMAKSDLVKHSNGLFRPRCPAS